MTNFRVLLKKWLPALIIMGIIFGISSIHGQIIKESGLGSEGIHVNGHFILYFFLLFAYYKATNDLLVSILLSFMFALSDEYHQSFVPERSASLKDIIVDSLGIILAGVILWKYDYLLPKKLKDWLNR